MTKKFPKTHSMVQFSMHLTRVSMLCVCLFCVVCLAAEMLVVDLFSTAWLRRISCLWLAMSCMATQCRRLFPCRSSVLLPFLSSTSLELSTFTLPDRTATMLLGLLSCFPRGVVTCKEGKLWIWLSCLNALYVIQNIQISFQDIWDMSASEVSLFHRIAPNKLTITCLLSTYLLTYWIHSQVSDS